MPRKKAETTETVEVKNERLTTLTKDGLTFAVSDPIQVSAFVMSGYTIEE